MNTHEAEVQELFDEPDNFFGTSALGIGMQLGKENMPHFSIYGHTGDHHFDWFLMGRVSDAVDFLICQTTKTDKLAANI